MIQQPDAATFTGMVDLASERLGGKALMASDEFFAPKENLLKAARAIYIPDKYTERGKWMDGWETRRKRTAGHDWCIVKLGAAGIIRGVDIDTSYYLGNNPVYASIDACSVGGNTVPKNVRWNEILPKVPLKPGSQNLFPTTSAQRWTHIRLNIYPDGGVARLRIYGEVVPDWSRRRKNSLLDLAAIHNGGLVVAASDMFFGSKENLIMPGRAKNMGDGWETRRRRGPGYDWAIVKLGRAGVLKKIEIDTAHFKGNYPDRCSVDVCYETRKVIDSLSSFDVTWTEIIPPTKLHAHRLHAFPIRTRHTIAATHVRLNIYPDGGVSRLRVWGVPEQ